MSRNAHRSLRIISSAAAAVLFYTGWSLADQTYTVRQGDNLYQIARRSSTTVSAIQQANHLKDGDILRPGQTLKIPSDAPVNKATPTTFGHPKHKGLEVRSGGEAIAVLDESDRVVILSREAEAYKVRLADGRTGVLDADAVVVEETRKPLPVSDPRSVRSDLIRRAYAYRGSPYRRGGLSSRGGFDCSGFVRHVYAARGMKLPHSSQALFGRGKPVDKKDLQPGDLVFFSGTYRRGISHVGLYVGKGKFIHASTPRGGVRVDRLDSAYYRRRYAGARRL